jgi:hypothetical protein
VVWAELNGDTPGPLQYFSVKDVTGTAKVVSFCAGQDGALHLVGQLSWLDHVRWSQSQWDTPERLGQASGSVDLGTPGCSILASGEVITAWLQWTSKPAWHQVDIRFARQSSGGWTPGPEGGVLRTLPDAITGADLARAPSVAADTLGSTVIVMWSEDKTLYMGSSGDGGGNFSTACSIADDVDIGHEFEAVSAFYVDGRFHVLYPNGSGELVHATLQ